MNHDPGKTFRKIVSWTPVSWIKFPVFEQYLSNWKRSLPWSAKHYLFIIFVYNMSWSKCWPFLKNLSKMLHKESAKSTGKENSQKILKYLFIMRPNIVYKSTELPLCSQLHWSGWIFAFGLPLEAWNFWYFFFQY